MGGIFRTSDLIPGVVAVGVLLLAIFLVDLGLPISIALALVAYFAARWVMPTPPDMSCEETFAEAQQRLGELGAVAGRLRDRRVYDMATKIRNQVVRITGLARSSTKYTATAQDVVDMYLDSVIELVTRYQRLEALNVPGADEAMDEVREILPRMEEQLNHIWEDMHRDDVVELQAETEKLAYFLDTGSGRNREVEAAVAAAEQAEHDAAAAQQENNSSVKRNDADVVVQTQSTPPPMPQKETQ